MNIKDAIDCAEHWFDCKSGFPGSTINGNPDAPRYVTLQVGIDGGLNPISEHLLTCKLIASLEYIRRMMGYGVKSRLYWRYEGKILLEDHEELSVIRTRIYIPNCKDYGPHKLDECGTSFKPHLHMIVDNSASVPVVELSTEAAQIVNTKDIA